MKNRIAGAVVIVALSSVIALALLAPRRVTLAEGEEPKITVEIAIPERNGKRVLPVSGEFHVVVTNMSGAPVKMFSQSCVEGRRQLLFEFIDGGNGWSVCRKPENVRRNVRALETLDPGEPMVLHVNLSSDAWDHPIPLDELKGRSLKVRAVFIGGAGPIAGVAHVRGAIDPSGKAIEPSEKPEPTPRPKADPAGTEAWTGTSASAVERTYLLE